MFMLNLATHCREGLCGGSQLSILSRIHSIDGHGMLVWSLVALDRHVQAGGIKCCNLQKKGFCVFDVTWFVFDHTVLY